MLCGLRKITVQEQTLELFLFLQSKNPPRIMVKDTHNFDLNLHSASFGAHSFQSRCNLKPM